MNYRWMIGATVLVALAFEPALAEVKRLKITGSVSSVRNRYVVQDLIKIGDSFEIVVELDDSVPPRDHSENCVPPGTMKTYPRAVIIGTTVTVGEYSAFIDGSISGVPDGSNVILSNDCAYSFFGEESEEEFQDEFVITHFSPVYGGPRLADLVPGMAGRELYTFIRSFTNTPVRCVDASTLDSLDSSTFDITKCDTRELFIRFLNPATNSLVEATASPIEIEFLDPIPATSANAGPDQTVDEELLVTLDGSGSSDLEGEPLNYNWTQIAGPTVALTGADTATPSFDAPYVSSSQTLTFELIVDDGTNFSDPDSVDIAVVSTNNPPVADAGNDGTVKPGAVATLDGSRSFDPENDPITYQWAQVSGTPVTLSDDSAQKPTFTAPDVVGDVLLFQLQLTDGMEASTPSAATDSSLADIVAVTIVANSRPVADAGPDQTKDEGSVVQLNGAGSSDSDGGDILSFRWSQTGGTPVTLSNSSTSVPTFSAPFVGAGGDDLNFALVVADDDPANPLASPPDDVVIHVSNINDPPSCNLAVADPDSLWPPTHKMKSVNIDGVMDSDAEFNTVTLQITSVTQDEPVNGLGDGDSSPDAVIQFGDPADSVLIRAERSGNGNGRVYSIGFTASDGFESCNGAVEVTVPHSRKSDSVDDGQIYDATQP